MVRKCHSLTLPSQKVVNFYRHGMEMLLGRWYEVVNNEVEDTGEGFIRTIEKQ